MSNKGWICLHRELLDKPIWLLSTPEQKCILVALLLMANHEGKEWEWKGEKYICQPGQMITSLEKIAKNSGKGISTQNVRTALLRFEKYEFLTNESTKQNRLITICNWDDYQSKEIEANKAANSQLTDDQQTTNNQLTTNNNVNNYNNNISTNVDSPNMENSDLPKTEKINYKEILNLYHSVCVSFPKVHKLSDGRKQKIRTRIRDIEKQFSDKKYIAVLEDIFSKMEASDFLRGNNNRNWKATIDWLFSNGENWIKVFEGQYDNKDNHLSEQEFIRRLTEEPRSGYQYVNGKLTLVVD